MQEKKNRDWHIGRNWAGELDVYGSAEAGASGTGDGYRGMMRSRGEARRRIHYDHPDLLETDLLIEHVRALKRGRSGGVADIGFPQLNRAPGTLYIEPRSVIVIESILR